MEINIKIDFTDELWERLPEFIQKMYVEQLTEHLTKFTMKANLEISQYLFLKAEEAK